MGPQCSGSAGSAAYPIGGRPHRRIGVEHIACKPLKEAGLRSVDAAVTKLHLRLRPSQCGRAHEGVGFPELVDETQNAFAGRAGTGPERNAHGGARRYAHAIAKRKHRIKHRTEGVGQTAAVHHGAGCVNAASAAQETGSIRFRLGLAQCLAFNDCVMRNPDFRLGRRAPSPRRQERTHLGHILGLHEEL